LDLLGFSENANAQGVYYRRVPPSVYYPPVYYPPGYYVSPYGMRGYVSPPPINVREGPDEKEGEKIIRSYLSRKKISFRMNRLLTFNAERGIFHLKPDFQLRNRVIIEYWNQGDEQDSKSKKEEFERYKETFRPELTIIKPYFLLDKKDKYEEYKKTGTRVYFIEPKDPNQPLSIEIEQQLDEIPEIQRSIEIQKGKELIKEQILLEREAERIISGLLRWKGIPFKRNTTFKTEGITIRPDFLLELEARKPLAI